MVDSVTVNERSSDSPKYLYLSKRRGQQSTNKSKKVHNTFRNSYQSKSLHFLRIFVKLTQIRLFQIFYKLQFIVWAFLVMPCFQVLASNIFFFQTLFHWKIRKC